MQNIKNHYFFKCLQRSGLRRIRFHDLRHTFASLLIQNGEPLAYVKDQLDASIKMTVDVYGHLVPVPTGRPLIVCHCPVLSLVRERSKMKGIKRNLLPIRTPSALETQIAASDIFPAHL
jgi:Phage integrase family